MYTSIDLYEKHNNHYNFVLVISCLTFTIPIFIAIRLKQQIHSIIIIALLITSILRWSYGQVVEYQYIDHNYVKLVYILSGYNIYRIANSLTNHSIEYKNKGCTPYFQIRNELTFYLIITIGCYLNIFFIYASEYLFKYVLLTHHNRALHAILHIYSSIGFCSIFWCFALVDKLNQIHQIHQIQEKDENIPKQ